MFKNSKKESSVDLLGKTNRIVEATIIRGDIEAVSDLRIDGELKGNLLVKGRVVVGPQAKVVGNIDCENADIEGTVEGIIRVNDLLTVKTNANIKGELIVGRLSVEPGGNIEVTCQMLGQSGKDSKSNGKQEKAEKTEKLEAVEKKG
ncbi:MULTISPECIES: polymer-forming cytoskeletal protein [Myroides]|uniref:Polymer-forming cytoskeletal protein n=1 Tax=Myroides albus TaxID=2562892 RepID=A0A6I3LKB4_9FLAO|nr:MULTISPECIES: polymer-forming cytoskeletal protein [Myroides]MTG96592.1 polymer-forming cytoskeletal protein [Myroides albus]MVX34588.1 polymer-forming cytoskeletal protein [Myroides sp. LoEW2-1]UVD80995.1 polymer-forming cytoskeletal protein [Myroides albus]